MFPATIGKRIAAFAIFSLLLGTIAIETYRACPQQPAVNEYTAQP